MNDVLEGILRKKYSYMFEGVPNNMPVNFDGIEAPDGWYDLIENTLRQIEFVDPKRKFRVAQIKSKFGGLRLYPLDTDTSSKQIYKIIDEAEEKSFKTCEYCGSTKDVKQRGGGWIMTLCDECFK